MASQGVYTETQLIARYQQARDPGLNDSAALSDALATRVPPARISPPQSQPGHTPPHLLITQAPSYAAAARTALAARGSYSEDEARALAMALIAEAAKRTPLLPARRETVTFQGQPQVMNAHGQIRPASASLGYSVPAAQAGKHPHMR